METRWYNFDPSEDHQGLERLIAKARQRYTEVGSQLSKHFVTQLSKAKHPIKGIRRQVEIYDAKVQPRQEEEKIAYVWVDALRFEMARELCEALGEDFKIDIEPAIGNAPTITEIGMASLLPKASDGKIISVGSGKIALDINGTVSAMKISRIRLQGFRTVDRGFDCRLRPLTIFTGANNSGKSGVIRALDLFFNNGSDPSRFAPHIRISPEAVERKKRFTILITVWLADLPDDISKTYARFIHSSGDLPVRLRFRPKDSTLDYLVFPNGQLNNKVDSGRVSQSVFDDISQHVVLRVIPESRDVVREFQTELGEVFSSMRESVIEATHGRAAKAAAELHQALDDILDKTLTKQLNNHLGQIIPHHVFRVGSVDQREFARIVMQAAFSHYPMCADSPDGDHLDLEQVGAGFQSSVLIALHRAVASLLNRKLILCVEEPEIHLDPNAQRRAYHEWSALSCEDNDVEQIIINSHSAFIVNESDPEELIVVRRDEDGRSVASQLPSDFLNQHDVVHLKTKVLGLRNSDLYFATGVVLVEGDSDAVALRG